MNTDERIERDSMGDMPVPASALYGAQTARAARNFPVSGLRFPRRFLRALGLLKKHAAKVLRSQGLLDAAIADAIEHAAQEVADGMHDGEFIVDIFQTGSGTSTNMNANEVIANRASERLGGFRGDRRVHPNDHVNLGQSSNDVIPTALHVAALEGIERELIPALERLQAALQRKADAFDGILKTGRTHLQDATPVRLGQEFGGYAAQVGHSVERLRGVTPRLGELALGGTAVGTGINAPPGFADLTIAAVADETGLRLRRAGNSFEAQGARDACAEASAMLRTVAISLARIANDIRWLGSGPRCGLGELRLPAVQPGSSIMPGKVNPVMCEMLIQVAAQVIGNDAAITFSNAYGSMLELNVMMPVIAYNLLQAIEILSRACSLFTDRCVAGLEADAARCAGTIERSLSMGTALAPVIGYDAAARIARVAYETDRTIREVALELSGLDRERIDALLDPRRQTEPG